MSHTKGPWHVGERDPYFVYAADGHMVTDCGRIHVRFIEEMEANARLCAAAPELLEACKAMPLDMLDSDDIDAADFKGNAEKFLRAMRMAKAAVAKTTRQ